MRQEQTGNPWRTLGSRRVYENPWISVREDSVVRPDGEPGIYGVVHYKNTAVGVLPVEDDHVYLVGQYRYPLDRYSWEIPEGGCPEGEEPLGAARRELREETGLEAGSWRRLGEAYLSNSVADEYAVWFLATDLVARRAAARRDGGHRRAARSLARGLGHGDGRQDHRRPQRPRPDDLRPRPVRGGDVAPSGSGGHSVPGAG